MGWGVAREDLLFPGIITSSRGNFWPNKAQNSFLLDALDTVCAVQSDLLNILVEWATQRQSVLNWTSRNPFNISGLLRLSDAVPREHK